MDVLNHLNENINSEAIRNLLDFLGEKKLPARKAELAERLNRIWLEEPRRLLDALSEPERVLPLGGARTGADASGAVWISLTDPGAYLLGRTEVFAYAEEKTDGRIVVQPNFEVVFTGASPGAESEFMQVAERIGKGVGTLFRITRGAILAALDAGLTAEDILGRMDRHVSKPVPANVSTQIQDWAAAYRRVGIREMLILSCPDQETALHVKAVLPQLVRTVAPTLLEITNPKASDYVRKKLKQHAIGVIPT